MISLSPEARAICDVLLDLHRMTCRGRSPAPATITDAMVDAATIRYKSAYERAGVPFSRNSGPPPGEIAEWCAERKYPPLHSLVVNTTGKPGFNYHGAAGGCSLNNWDDEVRACISFDGYPNRVP